MSEINLSFTIQGDSEGYVTFECPYCSSEFKLRADEFQNDEEPFDELYCPYCGLSKMPNDFYTEEVIEKAKAIATNYMIEELNKTFGKMQRDLARNNGVIKMSYKPLTKVYVKEIEDKDTIETIFECSCCNRHVKVLYCAGVSKIFCPYCGVDL
ncbi:hypothetical protein [Christensenella minuta]|uniref:hypothetical protein n=1 Tax=Christensenella minuta TaxID=626937 RepID=UPI002157F1A3|nr:hypothetical protein [Christensenella minuta]